MITIERIQNIFELCQEDPAKFSRVSALVAKIAKNHEGYQAKVLYAFSRALNEQRHVLIHLNLNDVKGAAQHSRMVTEELRNTLKPPHKSIPEQIQGLQKRRQKAYEENNVELLKEIELRIHELNTVGMRM